MGIERSCDRTSPQTAHLQNRALYGLRARRSPSAVRARGLRRHRRGSQSILKGKLSQYCRRAGDCRDALEPTRSMAPLIDAGDELADGSRHRVPARGIIHSRHELFGDFLAELHSPLIEGIDAPHDTLREHAVLVESNDPAESSRIELPEKQEGERA